MECKYPKISVIVPCLNSEDYIEECICSIINQTLQEIEIICVDAGSTDKTLEILNKYSSSDSRIHVVNSSRKSYGYQMNLGLSLANGEYIGIVESDDFIAEDMYEKLYNLTENGTADISKGTFYHYCGDNFNQDSLTIDWSKKELSNVENTFTIHDYERFIDGHPSIWAGIYRRKFLNDNKIRFVEESGGGWVDNGFFFETACVANRIAYRPIPCYYYREDNPNSSSNSLSDFTIPLRRMIENLEILEKHNCTDEKILHVAYIRVFDYLDNIFRRDGYEEHMDKLMPHIHKLMSMMDENIVLSKLTHRMYREYYPYLLCDDYDGWDECSDYQSKLDYLNDSYIDLKSEYIKHYNELKSLRSENKKLNEIKVDYLKKCEEVSKLKLENENLIFKRNELHQYIFDVENSKAFKLGLLLASPIRKYKKWKYVRNKRLNVLFIPSDNNRTSGAFLSMANLIINLKNKYQINELVVLPNEGNGVEILDSFNINYMRIESRDWVIPLTMVKDGEFNRTVNDKKKINDDAISMIRKVIHEHDIDIVHINTTYSYVGAEAALQENIPFVWHLREFLEEDQGNTLWDRSKGNNLINRADKIVAISDSIFKKYENIFDNDKLIRIYNGIDANKFYNPQKTIFNSNIVKFIMVGGFEYYKGQIEFANACVELYSRGFHDFEVLFVGTGRADVKEEVKLIFSSAGMDNVKFLGYKEDVENYYKIADISFTCAKSEAFGRTTVEAMLSGNLVIGADSAGTKELIKDNETGILYKSGDANDLCEKMLSAINNKDRYRNICKKGRRFMYENMTAEKNADNIYELYKNILF